MASIAIVCECQRASAAANLHHLNDGFRTHQGGQADKNWEVNKHQAWNVNGDGESSTKEIAVTVLRFAHPHVTVDDLWPRL